MSEQDRKTEQPTTNRLRKAREEGQVAHSKDLTQMVLTAALFGYMLSNADAIVRSLAELIVLPAQTMGLPFDAAIGVLLEATFRRGVELLAPFIAIAILVTLAVELSQTGMLISFKAVTPSGKKLDVVQNAKNMFSMKTVVEFLKSTLKICLLSFVLFVLLRNSLSALVTLPYAGIAAVGVGTGVLLKAMVLWVVLGYAVIAFADLVWQRHHHHKELMMTREEVERDDKETQGDPHIKHRRKELHRELMENEAVHSTRQATAVVTNPTHLAVAIWYERDVTALPVVLAKGEGTLAHRMVRAAVESGVPVLQNIPVARALTATARINEYIPSELIEPVAEVLRAVREMKHDEEQA